MTGTPAGIPLSISLRPLGFSDSRGLRPSSRGRVGLGSEMEVLATVGEQVGCMLVLARMSPSALESANHVELVLSSGPVAMKQ